MPCFASAAERLPLIGASRAIACVLDVFPIDRHAGGARQ
jgi:hypothetical protein